MPWTPNLLRPSARSWLHTKPKGTATAKCSSPCFRRRVLKTRYVISLPSLFSIRRSNVLFRTLLASRRPMVPRCLASWRGVMMCIVISFTNRPRVSPRCGESGKSPATWNPSIYLSIQQQRIASQAALRRTMLEITQAAESEPVPTSPVVHPQHANPSYTHHPQVGHSSYGQSQLALSHTAHAAASPSPRASHMNGSYVTGHTSSRHPHTQVNGHGYSYPHSSTYSHRIERSPDLEGEGRSTSAVVSPGGHQRKHSYTSTYQHGEGSSQTRHSVQTPQYSSSRAPFTNNQTQLDERDRRKRVRRSVSPPPPPPLNGSSYSRIAPTSYGSSSSNANGMLKLRETSPLARSAPATSSQAAPASTSASGYSQARDYAQPKMRTDQPSSYGDVRYSSNAPARGTKRDHESDEMEVDGQGTGSGSGSGAPPSRRGSASNGYSSTPRAHGESPNRSGDESGSTTRASPRSNNYQAQESLEKERERDARMPINSLLSSYSSQNETTSADGHPTPNASSVPKRTSSSSKPSPPPPASSSGASQHQQQQQPGARDRELERWDAVLKGAQRGRGSVSGSSGDGRSSKERETPTR